MYQIKSLIRSFTPKIVTETSLCLRPSLYQHRISNIVIVKAPFYS